MKEKAILLHNHLVRLTYRTKGHTNMRICTIFDYGDDDIQVLFDDDLKRTIKYEQIVEIEELI